jgi:phosphatidate cytidylyltransferase
MKRVATAVVLVPIVLILILDAPIALLAAAIALVAVLGTRELLDIATHYNVQPMRLPTYIYVVLVCAAVAVSAQWQTQVTDLGVSTTTLLALGTAACFVFLAIGMARAELPSAFGAAATSVVAVLYIAMPLALLLVVRQLWAGGFLLLYLLLVVWAGDTFAYYTGRAIGRHKLAPRISPGKTWEGSAASFIGSILVGWAVFSHAPVISAWLMSAGLLARPYAYTAQQVPPAGKIVLLSAIINIAAQVGDLVESLIKRGAGIKDSGTLLPGHGGILDRIDALLFAAPVLWYYATLSVLAQGHL